MENIFIERLNILRNGLSKNAFAQKCDIKQTTMLGYLNGTSQPNLENLIKISKANNVTIGWLAGEETSKKTTTIHQHFPDPSMKEMALWINEQNDGINYWEIAKAKLAMEFPEFREWLKKSRDGNSPPADTNLTVNEK